MTLVEEGFAKVLEHLVTDGAVEGAAVNGSASERTSDHFSVCIAKNMIEYLSRSTLFSAHQGIRGH